MTIQSLNSPVLLWGFPVLAFGCTALSPMHAGNSASLAFSTTRLSTQHRSMRAVFHGKRTEINTQKIVGRMSKAGSVYSCWGSGASSCLQGSRYGGFGADPLPRKRHRHDDTFHQLQMSTTSDSETQEQGISVRTEEINSDGSAVVTGSGNEELQREGADVEDGSDPQGSEVGRVKLPNIVNPFKVAFDAGRQLRINLATNLEQITGTPSPVRCSWLLLFRYVEHSELHVLLKPPLSGIGVGQPTSSFQHE